MTENGSGIILRVRPLKDTSLIVHWLTADQGRIATVARGARRPKSAFLGKLDLFFEATLSFQRSARSDLHTLREVVLTDTHAGMRSDFRRLNQAAYAVAFIEQMTEPDTPLPEIHELIVGFVRFLESSEPRPRNVFAFELKLLTVLGLEPFLDDRGSSNAVRELGSEMIERNWAQLSELHPATATARELRTFLHGFLIYHCGRLPHGRAEALEADPHPATTASESKDSQTPVASVPSDLAPSNPTTDPDVPSGPV